MAALGANANPPPRPNPATPHLEFEYPATGADEFYRGAVIGETTTAGTVNCVLADADESIGFCVQRATATAANDPIRVAITGIWWVACAQFATGDLWHAHAPAAASDNPADINTAGAGTPGTLGILVHVDATGVSGWLNLDWKVVPANS